MPEKSLDLSRTIYELCREDPAVVDVMKEAGFTEIANPWRRCWNCSGSGDTST